jgi:hypothetical protein
MKKFDSFDRYSQCVNFVDDNNVFVGFSMENSCCERFDYFFTRSPEATLPEYPDGIEVSEDTLAKYSFDPSFCETPYLDLMDSGGAAMFRLVCPGEDDLYLVLFNEHNGYYAHGITSKNFKGIEVPSCI